MQHDTGLGMKLDRSTAGVEIKPIAIADQVVDLLAEVEAVAFSVRDRACTKLEKLRIPRPEPPLPDVEQLPTWPPLFAEYRATIWRLKGALLDIDSAIASVEV